MLLTPFGMRNACVNALNAIPKCASETIANFMLSLLWLDIDHMTLIHTNVDIGFKCGRVLFGCMYENTTRPSWTGMFDGSVCCRHSPCEICSFHVKIWMSFGEWVTENVWMGISLRNGFPSFWASKSVPDGFTYVDIARVKSVCFTWMKMSCGHFEWNGLTVKN